jgi:dynactin complex subunit
MSGRKYDIRSQNGDCPRESNVRTSVSETKFLSKGQVVTKLNMEKIYLRQLFNFETIKRLLSSGILTRVAWYFTNIIEEEQSL